MNVGQYEGIMGALERIIDRMPVHQHRASCHGPIGELQCQDDPAPVGTPGPRKGSEMAADKRQALAIMRAVLDDWIKGAKENHEALGHRHENRGEECWRTFHAEDIRNMINDAARELGLQEFPTPEIAEEDS